MTRLAALLVAVVLGAAACDAGGGREANEALAETAENLATIESGDLSLTLLADSQGDAAGRVGFRLEGRFALPDEGELPVADMEYTQIAGDEEAGGRFLSTGERAYVEIDETVYELPEERQEALRSNSAETGEAGFGELEIDRWVREPEVEDGGTVDGVETDRITAGVDVVTAVNDLIELAGQVGTFDIGRLEGASAQQLERAVEQARLEVVTGTEDRLLRRLRIDVDFGAPEDLPPEFQNVLGAGVELELELELELSDVNEPVRVEAPADAQPFPG